MAHRKGRSVLTGTGIVLGVAIFFGVLVANATTQRGVDLLIEDFTGRADVVAAPFGAFDARLDESALRRLSELPGVEFASGSLGVGGEVVGGGAQTADEDEDDDSLFLRGVDLERDRRLQDYALDRGRFFRPGAAEIVVGPAVADERGWTLGTRVDLATPTGRREVGVVGILQERGAGRGLGSPAVYTSLTSARELAGAGAVYDGVGLILRPGLDTERWIDEHRDAVGRIRLESTDAIAQGFKSFLAVFGTFLTFFATITLFIGAFLIYLTLSMAIIERTRMYGTLRALGATRRQVRRIVLAEAGALGIVSTLLGMALGLALARGLLVLISGLFDLALPGLVVAPGAVIASAVVGVAVTLGASLIPAVRAGRLAPVEAMKGDYAGETRLGRAWMVGAALLTASLTVALLAPGDPGTASASSPVAIIGLLLGAILLVPLLLRPLAAGLGRLTNRLARGVGEIAVLHLSKERSRSAYTLALVMVVMAMLFATGGLYLSVREGIDQIIDRQFGADLFIDGQGPLDPGLAESVGAVPGVERVSPLSFAAASVTAPGHPEPEDVFVPIIDPQSYFELSSYFWQEGDDRSAARALAAGRRVLIPTQVARRLGDLAVGDRVRLKTPDANPELRVAGIYRDGPGPPSVTLGIRDGRELLGAGRPLALLADVTPGASPEQVKEAIENGVGRDIGLDVGTTIEAKEMARGQIAQYFRIVYAILLVAAIVGLLGLANTLAMSVLRRFREIGILRAIGVTRSQMWRMVLVESTTMGLAAFVLSIPLGWLLAWLVVRDTSAGFGFDVPVVLPWAWIPAVAAFGLAVAVVAAIAPGRRAARLEVVTALQYE